MFINLADYIPTFVAVSIPATAVAITIGLAVEALHKRKMARKLDAADTAAVAASAE